MGETLLTIGKWCLYITIIYWIYGLIHAVIIHPIVKKKPYQEWQRKRKQLQKELRYFDLKYRLDSISDINTKTLKTRYDHKLQIEALSGRENKVKQKYKRILKLRDQERKALADYES